MVSREGSPQWSHANAMSSSASARRRQQCNALCVKASAMFVRSPAAMLSLRHAGAATGVRCSDQKASSMNRSLILAFAFPFLMSACGGGSDSKRPSDGQGTVVEPPAPGSSQPTSPQPPPGSAGVLGIVEDKSAGLAGIDLDGNGIRDDVDVLIARDYSRDPQVTSASRQLARAIQGLLIAQTEEQARQAKSTLHRSMRCIWRERSQAIGAEERRELAIKIEALTVNTKERLRAYAKANSLVVGAPPASMEGGLCD